MSEHIDGAALLDEVERFHRRFNVFPTEAAYVATTLWDGHAHLMDAFDGTARLAFLSPEPGSGKSRALEIVETLTPRAATTVNASANALFRLVESDGGTPTLLFDEIDTVFGPKAGDNEPVRGFLNSGYRRGGKSLRCVGDGSNQSAEWFSSFCAVAMAGLGSLPDTILTRSIIIRMRKRAPNEKIEPYRRRTHETPGSRAAQPACRVGRHHPRRHRRRLARDARRASPTGPPTCGNRSSPSPTRLAGTGPSVAAPPAWS